MFAMLAIRKKLLLVFNLLLLVIMGNFLMSALTDWQAMRVQTGKIIALEAEQNNLKTIEAHLHNKVSLLSQQEIDADILGELARRKNALYGADETVIFTD